MSSPKLEKEKHVRYFLRCLKTFLPYYYTSNDANRMSLAFFIISALDLLGVIDTSLSSDERKGYIDWIYRCQHPKGGFRAFPGTDFDERSNETNAIWDPAHVPATYFALATLLILRDDFTRVKREDCLKWLVDMQRPDGSFGQTIGPNGSLEGGFDTRFGYTALCVRWFLRKPNDTLPDINIETLANNIMNRQTYDGGYNDGPFHEAHAGYTYCSVGALSIMNKLDTCIQDRRLLLHWLVSRQTSILAPDEEQEDSSDDEDKVPSDHASLHEERLCAGFNGRPNKYADTCYCWWVGATIMTLGHLDTIDVEMTKTFLLAETQHPSGGFGKNQGHPPDIFHSYMGLAALSIMGYPELKPVHSAACISLDALEHLKSLHG